MSPNWFFLKYVRPHRATTWHDVMSPRPWQHAVNSAAFFSPSSFSGTAQTQCANIPQLQREQKEEPLTQSDNSDLTHDT